MEQQLLPGLETPADAASPRLELVRAYLEQVRANYIVLTTYYYSIQVQVPDPHAGLERGGDDP